MSTHAVVLCSWSEYGVFVTYDGYPENMVPVLARLVLNTGLDRFKEEIIDNAPSGYTTLGGDLNSPGRGYNEIQRHAGGYTSHGQEYEYEVSSTGIEIHDIHRGVRRSVSWVTALSCDPIGGDEDENEAEASFMKNRLLLSM